MLQRKVAAFLPLETLDVDALNAVLGGQMPIPAEVNGNAIPERWAGKVLHEGLGPRTFDIQAFDNDTNQLAGHILSGWFDRSQLQVLLNVITILNLTNGVNIFYATTTNQIAANKVVPAVLEAAGVHLAE